MCDTLARIIKEDGVRVFVGSFNVFASQLAPLLRSCGANGTEPLAQPFRRVCTVIQEEGVEGRLTDVVFHPHYMVIFGQGVVRVIPLMEHPELPEFLTEEGCGLTEHADVWANRTTWGG